MGINLKGCLMISSGSSVVQRQAQHDPIPIVDDCLNASGDREPERLRLCHGLILVLEGC